MAEPNDTIPQPPAHLPIDPRHFYAAPLGTQTIPLIAQAEGQHVLEQLGPPPFRKSSFPVIGFLASLYEHVAAHVSEGGDQPLAPPPPLSPSPPQGF
jgi:hypothetical protein